MSRFRLGLVASIWVIASSILAQSDQALFDEAVRLHQARSYPLSQAKLTALFDRFPQTRLRSSALFLSSRNVLRLGYYRETLDISRRFLSEFPSSRYVAETHRTRAEAWYALERYPECIDELFQSENPDSALIQIARQVTSPHILVPLLNRPMSENLKDKLILTLAERQIARKRYQDATVLLAGSKNKKLSALSRSIRGRTEGTVYIGLITSMSGVNSETGRAIQRGAAMAVNEYNAAHETDLGLVIYDDQSDILQSIRAARALCESDSISLIVGPIESNAMASVALICNEARIPVLSPTASKTGLAAIGEYVYQANPDLESRARALARFAFSERGLRRFAVLAPADPYGEALAAPFSEEVEKLGGKIIAYEKYYDNTQDYRAQMLRIRKLGFIDKAAGDFPNSLSSKLSMRSIDSLYVHYQPYDTSGTETSSDYNEPLTHIDGLFLPIYTEDIKYIAPQLAFYNIKAQLLGTDHWNDLTELRLQQNYLRNTLFVSESFIALSDPRTIAFQKTFTKAYNTPPTDESYYSYDLIQMVGQLVSAGNYGVDRLQQMLRSGIQFEGLHNQFRTNKTSRVNNAVHILQFKDGRIEKISK